MATFETQVRRGLPRRPGGDPWPRVGDAPVAVAVAGPSAAAVSALRQPDRRRLGFPQSLSERSEMKRPPVVVPASAASTRPVRRGLPRVAGGEAWPPPSVVAASVAAAPMPEPERYGPFTKAQWTGAVVVGGFALLIAAGMAVAPVRWLLSLEPLQDFVAAYPGEYHLPEEAPLGIPAWLGWQHFFNVFLMVSIIRSGLQVRTEKRPTAFWSPRTDTKRRISLNLGSGSSSRRSSSSPGHGAPHARSCSCRSPGSSAPSVGGDPQ